MSSDKSWVIGSLSWSNWGSRSALWLSIVDLDLILVLLITQKLGHLSPVLSDLNVGRLFLSISADIMTMVGRTLIWKLLHDVVLVRSTDLVVDILQIWILLCGCCPPHVSGFYVFEIGKVRFTSHRLKIQLLFKFILVVLNRLSLLVVISLNRFA